MDRNLFSHVDIAPDRAHVFDGTVPEEFARAHAAEFERWIEADGGLDVQLLGIGRNGHIAFNEPCDLSVAEALRLPARLVELHPATREVAARDFGGLDRVIPRALTLGTAAILAARSILIVATGLHKAAVVARALDGPDDRTRSCVAFAIGRGKSHVAARRASGVRAALKSTRGADESRPANIPPSLFGQGILISKVFSPDRTSQTCWK